MAAFYAVVGIAFPNPSVADESQFFWRLSAWLVCAIAFGFHIFYEHFRQGSSSFSVALRVAISVAIGALVLAISANIHYLKVQNGNQNRLLLALVAWPIITFVPAFLAGLVISFVLARISPISKDNENL